MHEFSSTRLPQPKDWQDFERKSRVLFQCELKDSNVLTNGRSGQSQNGVDIFGRRGGRPDGSLVGVQCKGKDGDLGAQVTENELKRELKKAKNFKPTLDEFILVTTAPDDVGVQEIARIVQQECVDSGWMISVSVWGWETLQQRIASHHEALRAFSPELTTVTHAILENFKLKNEVDAKMDANIQLILSEVREIRGVSVAQEMPNDNSKILHSEIDDQIDQFRELIRTGKPKTALALLEKLRESIWDRSDNRIKFRILGNLGAAKHAIGEQVEAADLFLYAAEFDPENPAAISNTVAALLIKGQTEEAAKAADAALKEFPENAAVAIQRLQARPHGETISEACAKLNSEVLSDFEVATTRIYLLREEGETDWRNDAEELALNFPESDIASKLKANAIMDAVLEADPNLIGARWPRGKDEVEAAAEVLEHAWNDSRHRETDPDYMAANNAAIAFAALQNYSRAALIADSAIQAGCMTLEILRLRVGLFLEVGDQESATKLAEQFEGDLKYELVQADQLLKSNPSKARGIVETVRERLDESNHIFLAFNIIVDSFIQESNFKSAFREAEELSEKFPNHSAGPILKFKVLSIQGTHDAKHLLSEAIDRIGPQTDMLSLFTLARVLASAEMHEEVVHILGDHVDYGRDSEALRLYLVSALNADRRASVSDILTKLPHDVRETPFYLRLGITLSLRTQDLARAEELTVRYLKNEPRNLEFYIMWLQLLFRRGDEKTLDEQLARPMSEFDNDPKLIMVLAHLNAACGNWESAQQIAYYSWVNNQDDPTINLQYTGIFFGPGSSQDPPVSLDEVMLESTFCLISGEVTQQFTIDSSEELRLGPQILPPDHDISLAALGKRVGDTISIAEIDFRIKWIKHKYIAALHHILATFNLYFPDEKGLYRVEIPKNDEEGIKPIIDVARRRSEAIGDMFDTYELGNIPLSIVAKSLNTDTVEAFLGLVSAQLKFLVCDGNDVERNTAFAAINDNNRRGCVLDSLTLHIIRALSISNTVELVCGPLAIVASTVERLNSNLADLKKTAGEENMSIGWSEGQAVRYVKTVEEKKAAIGHIEAELSWIADHVEILPATGTQDAPQEIRIWSRKFGNEFGDEFLAAEGSGRLLVSEDHSLRVLAGASMNISSTWLQPILMIAIKNNLLERSLYYDAILAMIDYGATFISIDKDLLTHTLTRNVTLPLSDDYVKACSVIGGPNAEIKTHIIVALGALEEIWNNREIPDIVQQAATGALIECLVKSSGSQAGDILSALIYGVKNSSRHEEEIIYYIKKWKRGHFL